MTKEALDLRLWRDKHLYELARYISYGGRRDADVNAKVEEMRAERTGYQMMWAVAHVSASANSPNTPSP